jgi:hypothetical protein
MTTPLAKAPGSRRDLDTVALGALAQIALGALGQGGADASYASLKRGLREAVARDPMDAVLGTVLGGSYLFYVAEKGKNPKVESFWDALAFISTCLSVGYDDVFARTDAGKAIASFVMTFGPAISGAILEPPAAERASEDEARAAAERARDERSADLQRQILARLDAILAELSKRPAAT